jgi:hypothetical protein
MGSFQEYLANHRRDADQLRKKNAELRRRSEEARRALCEAALRRRKTLARFVP